MKSRHTQLLKRVGAAALAAALAVTGLPTVPVSVKAASKEIIANGTFDSDLTGWDAYESGTIEYASDKGNAGNGCIKVSRAKTGDGLNSAAGAVTDITGKVEAGETYTIKSSFYYDDIDNEKSYDETKFNLCIFFGPWWTSADSIQVMKSVTVKRGEWCTLEGEFTIPDNVSLEKVRIFPETVGWKAAYDEEDLITYYMDDVSVQKVGASDPDEVVDPETQIKLEAGTTKTPGRNNPLIDYQFGADPYAMEYNGRVYVYMTNDSQQYDATEKDDKGYPVKENGYDKINTITVISSSDMVNWTNHGDIPVAGANGAAQWANNSWAPAVCHKTIEGKEQFFLYFADGGGGIGVLVADSPIGPFCEPGESGSSRLIKRGDQAAEGVAWLFDPAVLVDDDGTGYLYYGGGVPEGKENMPETSRVVKLKDNMVELDGDAEVIQAPAVFEDSGIHKHNGTYYYTYCSNWNNTAATGIANICVMTSDSPMGPFEYQGIAFENQNKFFGIGGNNHHCFFDFNGKHYFTYHAQTVTKSLGIPEGVQVYRSTHIQEVEYDTDDKTIKPIIGTYEGVAQTQNLDPYEKVEAETIGWAKGIHTETCTEPGSMVESINQKVAGLTDGDYIAVSKADFGEEGAKTFSMKAKPLSGGNTVEIYLDAPDAENGKKVGEISIPINDASEKNLMEIDYWQFSKSETSNPYSPSGDDVDATGTDGWQEYSCEVSGVTGTHDVYIVMAEGEEIQKQKAAAVDELIGKIGEVECTDECKAKIDAARTAYNNLSLEQRANVTAYEALTAAEESYKNLYAAQVAAPVDELIDAIGEVVLTDECKAKIDAARTAFDRLTDRQQEAVTKLAVLEKAESDYAALAAADASAKENQEAADAVKALIEAIGTVTGSDECKAKIDAAREAYDALTEAQKALVSNADVLTKAEEDYEAAKGGTGDNEADQEAADAVKALIEAIGTVTDSDECKAKIDAAREAYDALTEAQKALVSNADVLTKAEADYKEASSQPDTNTNQPNTNTSQPNTNTSQPNTNTNQPGGDSLAANALKEGETYTAGSYSYKITSLTDKTASVVKTTKQSKTITVGDTVKLEDVTFKITEIGKNAFKNNKKATTVKIGKNVKTIGANAFSGCTKLKKVTINSKVLTKINSKAFYNCKKLQSMKISSSKIKTVGKQAFKGTAKKIKIDVPNSKAKAYKKLFVKKGLAKTAVVK